MPVPLAGVRGIEPVAFGIAAGFGHREDDDGSDDEPDCGGGETSSDYRARNSITRCHWFLIEWRKNRINRGNERRAIRTKATIADARRICINFGAWGVPCA